MSDEASVAGFERLTEKAIAALGDIGCAEDCKSHGNWVNVLQLLHAGNVSTNATLVGIKADLAKMTAALSGITSVIGSLEAKDRAHASLETKVGNLEAEVHGLRKDFAEFKATRSDPLGWQAFVLRLSWPSASVVIVGLILTNLEAIRACFL